MNETVNKENIKDEKAPLQTQDAPKSKHGFFDAIKEKANPVSVLLFALCMLLTGLLGFQTARVGMISAELEDMSEVHRAIYDMSQEVELAGKKDRIPEYNYALGDIAIPALEGVPKSKYKDENFKKDENGFLKYYEDGELCSYVGIDVSGHNGEIDFEKVKAAGVDFVMLRIGGRGYGEDGVLYDDTYFRTNLKAAKQAGLMVGAYFFSQAISAEEAREEALYSVSLLSGAELDYPLAFDWELLEVEGARTENISPQTLTDCARTFCDTVKEAGYIPCLYTGSTLAYYKYDLAQLSDVDIWYAFYNDSPDMYYNYMMWQYSCTGSVPGIEGDVDLNICFKNYK
ncbi:MAG: glycoside hydrolase family 25 protein [Ruminococcus sp.]|nr:glycoside hydrolase family 25 protein [Ruminococcus sp.]